MDRQNINTPTQQQVLKQVGVSQGAKAGNA